MPVHQLNHTQILLDSYVNCTGKQLIERTSLEEDAENLTKADFVIVSHNDQPDPILTYGNTIGLGLGEWDWDTFVKTPSRYTAQPSRKELREIMLSKVQERAYFKGYEGVRISASGKRFMIKNALIWNLIEKEGSHMDKQLLLRNGFFCSSRIMSHFYIIHFMK